jgi:parallel beta-helix repeat protein/predicted outer membrane repeat protein
VNRLQRRLHKTVLPLDGVARILEVRMRFLSALLLIFVFLTPFAALGTEVEGDVWGTWTKQNSPYNVIGEVRVPPESTLVIEPGVVVDFKGHHKLIVDSLAVLLAVGTESDSIYFTAEDTATGWHGIRFTQANSNSQISYCRIEYGKATRPDHRGGAILCDHSSPTIENNTIWKNWAETDGGGIYGLYSSPIIVGNLITRNNVVEAGGAIYIRYGDSSTVSDNIITQNSALWAGGIFCRGSRSLIGNNLIKDNSASGNAGGLLIVSPGRPTIKHNLIFGNSTGNSGGGIRCSPESSSIILGNLISNNSAALRGGGISCDSTEVILVNNTISENEAEVTGGGISCRTASTVTITNSILWANSAPDNPEIEVAPSSDLTITYTGVQGGWVGQGNLDLDPLFRDPGAGDFHLIADYCGDPHNSPCIDAGHPDSLDDSLDCGHGLGTDRADMGAYGGDNSGWPTGVEQEQTDNLLIPRRFLLHQNYPNPFNASTTIDYQLPGGGQVKLEIYNILGEKVATLFEGRQQPGYRSVVWEASSTGSGLYFYKLTVDHLTEARRMILVK